MIPTRMLDLLAQTADVARSDLETVVLYRSIESALQELVGFKLLTILQVRGDRLYRMHTSDLETYPTGDFKTISQDPWLRTMLGQGTPVVSPDPHTVQERFLDHAAIAGLGCGSVMNLPVTCNACTLGSLNLLHEPHWFTPIHLQVAHIFATQLAVAWLGKDVPMSNTWTFRAPSQ